MFVHRVAAFSMDGRGGNPAGVVLLNELPAHQTMLDVAEEVGYSETTFASLNPDGSWETRYFSPEAEVPFCGHATIALGSVLGRTKGEGRYSLKLAHASIEVAAISDAGRWVSTLTSPPTRSARASAAELETALALFGYHPDDLDENLPAHRANAGTEHLVIALKNRGTLARFGYDLDRGRDFMREHGIGTVAFVFRESERVFHARNAFAIGGVLEDPATGAAAAALAGMLRDLNVISQGAFTIHQGEDMGMPCLIEVEITPEKGAPVQVRGETAEITV